MKIENILVGGQKYSFTIDTSREAKPWKLKQLQQTLQALGQEICKMGPISKAIQITEKGIRSRSFWPFSYAPLQNITAWEQYAKKFLEYTYDPYEANIPEKDLVEKGKAKVTFGFVSSPKPTRPDIDRSSTIEGELKRLTKDRYNPQSKSIQESMLGVRMGMEPRGDYKMQVALEGGMKSFFQGKKKFISTEVLARNSPLHSGALTSSFHRFADTVTSMRRVAAEDGTSDFYTGRVDTVPKAKELIRFLFLSELKLGNQGKGITRSGNIYNFRFAIQSLLSMSRIQNGELQRFKNEQKAFAALFEELKQTNGILTIEEPGWFGMKTYQIRIDPLPIAASQFNFMTKVEDTLAQAFTGKTEAQEASEEANKILIQYALSALPSLDPKTQKQILDTIDHLEKFRLLPLPSWQEVMHRTFLCHLLGIPIVLHCKSSIDRTNLAGATAVAMKQWIRSGREIPQVDGKYDVCAMVNVRIDEQGNVVKEGGYAPFKELFAYSLHRGSKIAEFSRGMKGFKYNADSPGEVAITPALFDLLPERYLTKNNEIVRQIKIWALRILFAACIAVALAALCNHFGFMVVLAGIALAASSYVLTYKIPCLRMLPGLVFTPLKIMFNAHKLFSKYRLNHEYANLKDRKLIIT